MAWEYTNADQMLRGPDRFRLRLVNPDRENGAVEGCSAASSARAGVGGRIGARSWDSQNQDIDIEFQFPPKVLTDGRKGNWAEPEVSGGQEPYAVYKTSGPRELSLSWVYIVDSFSNDSIYSWNIERITRNIRRLRGYFATIRTKDAKRDGLAVMFHMWCIGGTKEITARIRTIDVKYGETLVFPPGGAYVNPVTGARTTVTGASDRAFPLRTDITVDLRIWTKGLRNSGAWRTAGESLGLIDTIEDKLGAQDIKKLTDFEPPDWY
jgi:hypothetical protein